MLGTDVLVGQTLGFFGGVREDALALVAQGQVNRRGKLLPDRDVFFNFLTDGFNRGVGGQESIVQGFVFPQKSQQHMLRRNMS